MPSCWRSCNYGLMQKVFQHPGCDAHPLCGLQFICAVEEGWEIVKLHHGTIIELSNCLNIQGHNLAEEKEIHCFNAIAPRWVIFHYRILNTKFILSSSPVPLAAAGLRRLVLTGQATHGNSPAPNIRGHVVCASQLGLHPEQGVVCSPPPVRYTAHCNAASKQNIVFSIKYDVLKTKACCGRRERNEWGVLGLATHTADGA